MDNIELVIEESEKSIPELMQEEIPDDATVITIKFSRDISDNMGEWNGYRAVVDRYLRDCGAKVLASSAGVHLNGRSQKFHIHYHLITERFIEPSNPSQHRKRWCSKNDEIMDDISFKYQQLKKDQEKYAVLSYPLKEGRFTSYRAATYRYLGLPMSNEMMRFLADAGKAIYDKELGLAMRQEKSEERKQATLTNLYDLCNQNKQYFSSFKEMMEWLDVNYIAKLELTEMPCPKNYKTNCQKISVYLGFLKYSQL